MPNVTVVYGRLSDLIVFFGNFHILLHVWNVVTSYKTITNCVLKGRNVEKAKSSKGGKIYCPKI